MRHPDDLTARDLERVSSELHMALLAQLPDRAYASIVAKKCEPEMDNAFVAAVDLRWIMGDTDAWSGAWAGEIATAAAAYHNAIEAVAARARALADADSVQHRPENVAALMRPPS